ncbi:hypothetical protein JZ751_002828 [Albula glossodonta]|uniref:Protein kinase domain-containing protein n=1 Tax=Albula glossodonta TaxID=121402 RepID=A0A8T2NCF2_9TELE|nr:hypothetical protein JZ751_002828 [Albula glossodonta]
MAKRDYLVDAAKQIRMALDREVSEDYEAAFNYYKNGVDLLLNGVQAEPASVLLLSNQSVPPRALWSKATATATAISAPPLRLTDGKPGYSSLRFRPIRNLSSPVEDLKMCKVIGVIDKVLTVQSLITKETFVVKSLPKSCWESRDQPTIIPQGVPFMVKLLRYYVSEDSVYLHLEHVQGGRLLSKLHKSRNDRVKEHPECCSPSHTKIRLKTSYTTPTISLNYQQSERGSGDVAPVQVERNGWRPTSDSLDTDSPASWDEAQHRLESCRTHSYCEETGCLYSARAKPRHPPSEPSPDNPPHMDPMHSTHPLSETQENPTLQPQCCITGGACQTPNAQEVNRAESDAARKWSSPDPPRDCESFTPGLSIDLGSNTGTCVGKHQATRDIDTNKNLPNRTDLVLNMHQIREEGDSVCRPTTEETQRNSVNVFPTKREQSANALPAETVTGTPSGNAQSPGTPPRCHVEPLHGIPAGISLSSTGTQVLKSPAAAKGRGTEVEEEWEVLSPLVRDRSQSKQNGEYQCDQHPSVSKAATPQCETAAPDGLALDQPIEVDGWFLLPRFPARKPTDRARLHCWGLPEGDVRLWGAQILLGLESLHQQGILCRDLNPKNILLDSSGKACLTYFGQWTEVQTDISTTAMEQMYCAPEVGGVSELTEACDWWSLGALLYELLTGMPLWQCHPTGVRPHTQLLIPDDLSTAAASLLTELLQYDAGYRLGSGGGGVSDIKCHPFFSSVPWHTLSS